MFLHIGTKITTNCDGYRRCVKHCVYLDIVSVVNSVYIVGIVGMIHIVDIVNTVVITDIVNSMASVDLWIYRTLCIWKIL